MATGIAAVGDREFSGNLGWENNELHRKIYVQDFTKISAVLTKLFGDPDASGNSFTPHQFPAPFDTFHAWDVNFIPIHQKATQGSSEEFSLDFLDLMPVIHGGVIMDIIYKPYDFNYQSSEETADYSAQTMSIIANAIAQLNNPDGTTNALTWQYDNSQIANLQGVIKIIPKVELFQKKVFLKSAPTAEQVAMIGSVNKNDMQFLAQDNTTLRTWKSETLLLTGMPVIRRWRWDGHRVFEVHVKFAANVYEDSVAPYVGGIAAVGWNRLYRVDKGWWDIAIMPNTDGVGTIYPSNDLSFVNYMQ